MIRKTILFTTLLLISGVASAQNWIEGDVFPDSSAFWRGAHGVAVDAEGKIWLAQYYPTFGGSLSFPTVINGDTLSLQTSSLHVFNADGTKAMEPMHALTFNGVTDTLAYRPKGHANNPSLDAKRITGVKVDHNGDIIVVVGEEASLMFRINHKTGEVMNRVDFGTDRFGSPASPGIDAAGNIYVAPVQAIAPISIFDPDFVWIGNVSLNSPGVGRAVEVSADGNSVYWSAYTHRGTYKYHRASEFSQYDSLGLIHEGLLAQGSARHPTTGYIWLGHGGADVSLDSTGMFRPGSELTLYAIDPEADDAIVDSLHFDSPFTYCGSGINRNVRGIGFSPDGIYAYVGIFDAVQGENTNGECKWFFDSSHKQKFVFKKFMRGQVTNIQRDPVEIPDGFTLSQNYPNPFNPQTNIEFEIKDAGLATLKVYDVLGREVATLVDEHLVAGKYTATFNATDLSSGTYVYQLNVAGHRLSGTMTLVK
ncbi:MAG: T9SS type A sorting domain-containing protein [Bacteroidetes bacterium]|nr:T9SS type A sorting domain-containing protein [Bacteroidota bacterium]